ncbi:UNVERIFIED_CONTAM: hypothetical protein Scaly_2990200 [Sesamum calycinum]|uniref:Uncharacterized protein n=1 Tax=Sesamum calycinum TaxID=2727403 RepID=A0AAW2KE93_9LAMI
MFINHASRTRATACLTIRGRISTALSSRRLPGVQKNSKRISSRGDFARLASSLIGNQTHSREIPLENRRKPGWTNVADYRHLRRTNALVGYFAFGSFTPKEVNLEVPSLPGELIAADSIAAEEQYDLGLAPSHDLERKRSPCYYKASKLLPQGHCCVAHGDGVAPTSIGPWFDLLMRIEPQRGMPSTRALLTTNHSLAGRSGSAFQVRYPNRLLSSTGSLAPSSILSTALLLGSILLQPLAVIACFSGGSHPGWCG